MHNANSLNPQWSDRLRALRSQYAMLADGEAGLDEAALLRSWRRCQGAGLDHRATVSLRPCEQGVRVSASAQRALSRVTELVGASIDAAGAVVIATDVAGTVVHAAGRAERLPPRWRGLLQAGTAMAESQIGTSAPTLAAIERRPQTVIRDAHFWRPMELFHCTAVPLFHPGGGMLGALDISGYESLPALDALNLLRLAADRIEDDVLREEAGAGVMELLPPVGLGAGARPGLIAVGGDGAATALNSIARRWLFLASSRPLPLPLTLLLGSEVGHIQRTPRRFTAHPVEVQLPTGWVAVMNYGPPGAHRASVLAQVHTHHPEPSASAPDLTIDMPGPPLAIARVEAVRRTLAQCHGNVSEAARRLGISRNSIYRWMAGERGGTATD